MRRRNASFFLIGIALTFVAAPSAGGQSESTLRTGDELVGTVLFDGRPIEGVPITLHRVTPQASGAVAGAVSDAGGSFQFTLEPDPAAAFTAFFVTAEHLSVRYFGPPIHSAGPLPENYSVVVYDTTSVLPQPLRIPRRDVAMAPLADGSWEVNELIRVTNPSPVALVADPGMPTWEIRIPESATDFEAGEGDILPHELVWMEDRVMLLTPLPPGTRELYIRYRIPARPTRSTISIAEATDTLNLFVAQPSHLNDVVGLQSTTMIAVDGENYLRYGGTNFAAGSAIELAWSGAWSAPVDPVIAAVITTLALLAIGAFAAFRNRRAAPPV